MEVVDESLIDRYCVVVYDKLPYPGLVHDVDENDLHCFWPLIEEVCWYQKDNLVTLLVHNRQL